MEFLCALIVIAILSSISIIAVGRMVSSAKDGKLQNDVATLNRAIKLYQANGGSLQSVTEPQIVLNKLKSSRSRADKALHTGAPSGRLIDIRIVMLPVSSGSDDKRAFYDSNQRKFRIRSEGTGFTFDLDENLNESFTGLEDRSPGAVSYASESNWVWDHTTSEVPVTHLGADVATISNAPDTGAIPTDTTDDDKGGPRGGDGGGSGGSDDDDSTPDPVIPQLATPQFSPPPGNYPETSFPLTVTIVNLPPSTNGTAYIRTGRSWTLYADQIRVPGNSDSIEARFVAVDPEEFQDSDIATAIYYPIVTGVSGSSQSAFHSPSGGENLDFELTNSNQNFTHGSNEFDPGNGDPPVAVGLPNEMSVSSLPFQDVPPDTAFPIANLTYYNGNSYYNSHASSVSLNLQLQFSGQTEPLQIDIALDLVNTPNDPTDPVASADYVRLLNIGEPHSITIGGVQYDVNLSVEATDSFGFSSSNQFHVYEGNSSTAEISATITPASN